MKPNESIEDEGRSARRFWDSDRIVQLVALALLLFIVAASLWGRRQGASPRRPALTGSPSGGTAPAYSGPDWETLHQYYHTYGIEHGHQKAPRRPGSSSGPDLPAIDPTDPSTWLQPLPYAPVLPPGGPSR